MGRFLKTALSTAWNISTYLSSIYYIWLAVAWFTGSIATHRPLTLDETGKRVEVEMQKGAVYLGEKIGLK